MPKGSFFLSIKIAEVIFFGLIGSKINNFNNIRNNIRKLEEPEVGFEPTLTLRWQLQLRCPGLENEVGYTGIFLENY